MNHEDQPLNDNFYQNPLEYMQNYVRNLNNELFLSEYHINNLYALLLIGRTSPWDAVKGNNPKVKDDMDAIVNQKVHNVKQILESLSNAYEDKTKKTAITQIEKLMGILKSKKKSIFIEKDKNSASFRQYQTITRMAKQLKHRDEHTHHPTCTHEPEPQHLHEHRVEEPQLQNLAESEFITVKQHSTHSHQNLGHGNVKTGGHSKPDSQLEQQHSQPEPKSQITPDKKPLQPQQSLQPQINIIEDAQHTHKQHENCTHEPQKTAEPEKELSKDRTPKPRLSPEIAGREVFSIFYGLSNMANLTALALTNIIEYNAVDRFIKFKMSETYNMTIKSEDPYHFDTTSQISGVPPELFTSHIFPYLSASELFRCRSVCKQWLDHVKQSWHSTFKREMFVQLLACEFCKDIEFYYKLIQLRNPFFQKLSLLIHALIEIINWELIANYINTNTLNLQLKRVLIILFRLMGEQLPFTSLNSLTDAFFEEHKSKFINLKEKTSQFFTTLSGSDLSINELRLIKTHFLDDHFMRVEEVNAADDKTPLLLNLLVKQITLQQILRNHIYLAQEYLLNTKKRLDNISSKMVYQKGYLQGVYKILLLKSSDSFSNQNEQNELPNFNEMLQSIFTNNNCQKPDFVLKSKYSSTQIYLDSATKLDIILSTVYNLNERSESRVECDHEAEPEKKEAVNDSQEKQEDIVFIKQYENGQTKVQHLAGLKKETKEIVNEINIQINCSKQTQTQTNQQPADKK